jgi:hypothetical protein
MAMHHGGRGPWHLGRKQVLSTSAGIEFLGSKSFTHASTTPSAVSLTDLKDESGANVTLLEGDLVVVNFGMTFNSSRTEAQMLIANFIAAFTPPTYSNDGNDCQQLVQYKFMTGTPDTSLTPVATDSTNRGVAGNIMAFRGVNLTTPIDVAATTATGVDGHSANSPAITPTTTGAVILVAATGGVTNANATWTAPAGLESDTNNFAVSGASSGVARGLAAMGFVRWTGGAYDPAAFGVGGTTNANDSWSAASVALRPA